MSAGLAVERPRSLTATVTDRLRQAIIDAELPLGGELSEVGLAAKLGVSRTPVREALATLQLQGMVHIAPQKGSYVFFPTEEDLVELCEYRIVLESRAISFALARRRDEALTMLEAAQAAMAAARERGDSVAYARADTRFHEAFIKSCRNRYLQDGYALVAGRIATLRTHLSVPRPELQERSLLQHEEMLRAFTAGDVLTLESVLVGHILATRQSYVRALHEGLIGLPVQLP